MNPTTAFSLIVLLSSNNDLKNCFMFVCLLFFFIGF
jgi:hypothetical protein